jgi:hypothetical protein
MGESVLDTLGAEVEGFRTAKGTLQFTPETDSEEAHQEDSEGAND